jgi:hypothetical protein
MRTPKLGLNLLGRCENRKRDDNGVRMRHASISFDRSQLASVSHANVLSCAHLSLNQFKHVSGSLIVFFLQFTSLMEPPKGIHDKLHDDTDESPEKRQWKQVRVPNCNHESDYTNGNKLYF